MNKVSRLRFLPTIAPIALLCLIFNIGCLIPLPMLEVVANCEIRGEVKVVDTNLPVENMMIFAVYEFKKDMGTSKKPTAIGPIYSDSNGRFVIPKFLEKKWYLEHLNMGDCAGDLLFVHPTLGAFTVLICKKDYPPELPFKELKVTAGHNHQKWTMEMTKYSYKAIERLPEDLQIKAWAHVSPKMRPN